MSRRPHVIQFNKLFLYQETSSNCKVHVKVEDNLKLLLENSILKTVYGKHAVYYLTKKCIFAIGKGIFVLFRQWTFS